MPRNSSKGNKSQGTGPDRALRVSELRGGDFKGLRVTWETPRLPRLLVFGTSRKSQLTRSVLLELIEFELIPPPIIDATLLTSTYEVVDRGKPYLLYLTTSPVSRDRIRSADEILRAFWLDNRRCYLVQSDGQRLAVDQLKPLFASAKTKKRLASKVALSRASLEHALEMI